LFVSFAARAITSYTISVKTTACFFSHIFQYFVLLAQFYFSAIVKKFEVQLSEMKSTKEEKERAMEIRMQTVLDQINAQTKVRLPW